LRRFWNGENATPTRSRSWISKASSELASPPASPPTRIRSATWRSARIRVLTTVWGVKPRSGCPVDGSSKNSGLGGVVPKTDSSTARSATRLVSDMIPPFRSRLGGGGVVLEPGLDVDLEVDPVGPELGGPDATKPNALASRDRRRRARCRERARQSAEDLRAAVLRHEELHGERPEAAPPSRAESGVLAGHVAPDRASPGPGDARAVCVEV